MLRFLADENFNGMIVRGALLRQPQPDVVRVQDVGLSRAKDPIVLEWAAQHDRIVLTHDVQTMTGDAYARVNAGLKMPGVIAVVRGLGIGLVIDGIVLAGHCGLASDFESQVIYLGASR